MGTDEDELTPVTQLLTLKDITNMSPKHRLLEVEREQGANRKSFQVGQHLSLEKEK